MAFFYNTLRKTYKKEVPVEGLAVFRIAYGMVLLLEVAQLFYFRKLIFDPTPYIDPAEINISPILFAWLLALGCLVLGLFTKYVTVINLVLSLATFSSFRTFEYHLDWSLVGVNLLLPFLPLSTSCSVDNLLHQKKYKTKVQSGSTTSQLYYYLPVLIGLGLVYFDSIFWKFGSDMWTKGLGFWLPTSLPQNTYVDLTPILNLKFLSISLGYITLFYELLFIFLIWNKKFRLILLIIGIGLHLGIFIAYPIPLFALGIISIYTLLIPANICKKLINKASLLLGSFKQSTNGPSEFSFSPDSIKTQAMEDSLLKYNKYTFPLIYAFVLYCFFAQSLCLVNTPIIDAAFQRIGLQDFSKKTSTLLQPLIFLNKLFLGITNHDVFLDNHFKNYNHIIAITFVAKNGQEEWLPIINNKGQVSYYNTGKQWAKWTWRTNNPTIDQQTLTKGMERFTAFWAGKHNINLNNATFKVKVKKIDIPTKWEKDFLRKQIAKPWISVGEAKWKDRKFSTNIPPIETLY